MSYELEDSNSDDAMYYPPHFIVIHIYPSFTWPVRFEVVVELAQPSDWVLEDFNLEFSFDSLMGGRGTVTFAL